MNFIFLNILNISIIASIAVIAVLVIRAVFTKMPKGFRCLLWSVVGIRLIFPFALTSIFSIIPNTNIIVTSSYESTRHDTVLGGYPKIGLLEAASSGETNDSVWRIMSIIWLIGMALMIFYSAVQYVRLKKRVAASVNYRGNIFLCDNIDSPFVLGIFRPRIYWPSGIDEEYVKYVTAHEKIHIRRRDNLWKPLGFALLSIYWFNPMIWIAYSTFCGDIELACDEAAVRDMDNLSKKEYAAALVGLSMRRRTFMAYPLAFGETGLKNRVREALNYKKASVWKIILSVFIFAIAVLCIVTNPKTTLDGDIKALIENQLYYSYANSEYDYFCIDAEIWDIETSGDKTTVYMSVLFSGNYQDVKEGSCIPTVLTLSHENGNFTVIEYWTPSDGEGYADDIREKFPPYLRLKAFFPIPIKQVINCKIAELVHTN